MFADGNPRACYAIGGPAPATRAWSLRERGPPGVPVVRALRRYGQRVDDLEVQHGLGSQRDLLAFLGGRHSGPGSSAGGRSDGRPFATSDDTPENCARRGSDANLGCGVLALTFALPRPLIGLDIIGPPIDRQ